MCCNTIDLWDFTAILMAVVSALIAFLAYRLQKVVQLQQMLFLKAQEANSYLKSNSDLNVPFRLSGIYSAIISGRQLMEISTTHWTPILQKQFLIDQFYLGLHTSIRLHLQDKLIESPLEKITDPLLLMQVNECRVYFKESIKKYQ